MAFFHYFSIISILWAFPASGSYSVEPPLLFLSAIFRHGDRAPAYNNIDTFFPNDLHKKMNLYPVEDGGLTSRGKQREYNLGMYIRHLYGDFLGSIYTPGEVLARSTDYDRTKMSLQQVLTALYPPTQLQRWNFNLNMLPTIANSVPEALDYLMFPLECQEYKKELARVTELPEVKNKIARFQDFMKHLSVWTGTTINTPIQMFALYQTLMAEMEMNLLLPDWSYGIFPHGLLEQGCILQYDLWSYSTKLNRLNGGFLLRNITENMERVRKGTQNGRKAILLSGHEFNVAGFLKALKVYTPHVPQYSSAVFVEFRGDEYGRHYVKIRYYKGIPAVSEVMTIPGCSELCPFPKFIELLSDVMPSDKEIRCQKLSPQELIEFLYQKYSRID